MSSVLKRKINSWRAKSDPKSVSRVLSIVLLVVAITQTSQLTHADSLSYLFPLSFNIQLLIWLLCYVVAGYMLLKVDRIYWVIWLTKKNVFLSFLILFACASIFWSVDTTTTAKRSFHLVGTCVLSLYIASNLDGKALSNVMAVTLVCLLGINTLVCILLPDIGLLSNGHAGAWSGLTGNKNTLGMFAAVTAFISFYQIIVAKFFARRCIWLLVTCFSVYVNWKSGSTTALLALGASCCTLLFLYIFRLYKIRAGVVYFTAVYITILLVVTVAIAEFNVASLSNLVGKDSSFTGRTGLWSRAWKIVMDRPIAGHGYGAIWGPHSEFAFEVYQDTVGILWFDKPVVHAHNVFVQLSSDLGIFAASIAVIYLLYNLIRATSLYLLVGSADAFLFAALGMFIIVHNFSEFSFLDSRNGLWVIYLLILFRYNFAKVGLENIEKTENRKTKIRIPLYLRNRRSRRGKKMREKKKRRMLHRKSLNNG